MISVIVPVYNAELYLSECLDSLIIQSYKNIEIIIVNDGSTDSSLNIIKDYASRDVRIKFLSTQNLGCSSAMNLAINLANGKYIARMDADDICKSDRFEKQLNFLIENNLDLCGSSIDVFYGKTKKKWLYPLTQNEIKTQLLFNSSFAHPTVFAKAAVFKSNLYSEDGGAAEDYELWTKLILKNYRMANMEESLLLYRIHADQISTSKQAQQHKKRFSVAKNYWVELGTNLTVESITSFSNLNEPGMLVNILKKYNADFLEWSLINKFIWKMAMRSPDLGIKLYLRLNKADVSMSFKDRVLLVFMLTFGKLIPNYIIEKIRIYRPNH